MGLQKLLNRCGTLDDDDLGISSSIGSGSMASHFMSAFASDAVSQFAVFFSALVHDLKHEGVSSRQLSNLHPTLCEEYNYESVAEQNSITVAWEMLMDPSFKDLQQCLFASEEDLLRFRQLLVNCVLATDLSNAKALALRNQRWDKAFQSKDVDPDFKATAVLEACIQVSDISHIMQHWKVFLKWNERVSMVEYGLDLQK